MTKEQMWALKCVVWLPAVLFQWLYAARGYSSMPRFDMWFWGIGFWLDILIAGFAVTCLVLRWK